MPRFPPVLCVLATLAGPAAAQGYGSQPFGQGGAPSFGYGQQPGPGDPLPVGAQSLVGAWSGQRANADGFIQQTDYFSPDGQFTTVMRFPNGFIARAWGHYRASPAGPNRLRVALQLQELLPRQVCRQAPGLQPECRPFRIPPQDTVLVTFTSPGSIQSVSQTAPGPAMNEVRDPQGALLQVQAPQRWVINLPPPQQAPAVAPVVTPYQSPVNRGPATSIPGLGGNCDDLQQRRICNMNGGALIRGRNGCLVCSG